MFSVCLVIYSNGHFGTKHLSFLVLSTANLAVIMTLPVSFFSENMTHMLTCYML